MHLLQINFRVSISRDAYQELCAPVAEAISGMPGLLWKAWVFNEEVGTAGGIYLFEDKDALDSYLNSSIVKGMKESPAFSEISVNRFEVLPELSKITRFASAEEKLAEVPVELNVPEVVVKPEAEVTVKEP
jgi:hypothetical protein